MVIRKCKISGCKDRDGNCSVLALDGLPAQCVGPWVEDKYFFLEGYLNASCEARRKFSDKGNAVFVDLFAGPGKCIIKNINKEIDSGGMRALNRDEAPFNEYFLFDISKVNVEALEGRTKTKFNCHIQCGDSNILIQDLVKALLGKYYRYHFAFIDPFGPENLKFKTLVELAKLDRMDMLIHFPIGAIKRNLPNWIKKTNTILDDFLGTDIWRKKINASASDNFFKILIDTFKTQLQSIGYPDEGLKLASSDKNIYTGLPTVPVRNTREVELYVLVLASKHPLGQKIWQSIIKTSPNGQKSLF